MPEQTSSFNVQLLVAADSTGGACSVFALDAPRGTVLPPHRRGGHDLALVVLAGAAAVRLDDAVSRVAGGEIAWLPRGAACRVELLADSRLLCVVLPGGFEDLAAGPGGPLPDADDVAVLLGLAGVNLLPLGWGAAPTPAQ